MTYMAWREDSLHRLAAAAASMDDVVIELAGIVHDLGFEYCSYVLRTGTPICHPSVIWSSTYPQKWLDRYFSNQYLEIDPVLQGVSRSDAPLTWSNATTDGNERFWEEAKSHGIKHGWAVASYGRYTTMGILSLARSTSLITKSELSKNEMKMVWLSQVVHGLIAAAELPKTAFAFVGTLSHREREILRWSAAGKTADEIASILSITERTVTFHITSILAKLNVVNKTQAVATALLLGILG
ncbi:autoinducer binding domain-containing protein [Dyella acidiphila]|uniref:Autoinducer binding domain-containing protein n=1 Tax=Dyella acidiphila TaxID=2775866 RepID=A0ABR9GFL4_9GAMM|nr:autoinducer binding domain-containing protein [Dyella acidiphila]MBE1162840.1 autoinducer binding domain-containing protein [Dyella acidiphila]